LISFNPENLNAGSAAIRVADGATVYHLWGMLALTGFGGTIIDGTINSGMLTCSDDLDSKTIFFGPLGNLSATAKTAYGASSGQYVEIGAANDTAVAAGKVYAYRLITEGASLDQQLKIRALQEGGGTVDILTMDDDGLIGPMCRLTGWVADDAQNPSLGTLPANSYVTDVRIQVTEAFDSDGTDQIEVGFDTDTNGYATLTDVSSLGILTPTMGVFAGFNSTARAVEAYYRNSGTEPTTGKALVTVEYYRVSAAPA
jgi:hypothetical protein